MARNAAIGNGYLPWRGASGRWRGMTQQRIEDVAERAQALFNSREMLCSEAIMVAMNDAFGGGLERERARALAMGFGNGIGGSGCVCGALAGAVLAASWLLSGRLSPGEVRQAGKAIHDAFKGQAGSSCCRMLTKPVRHDKNAHFGKCSGLTGLAARIAAQAVLERAPELAGGPGTARPRRTSRLAALLRRLADRLG